MHCLQLSRKLSWRAMWRNHMLLVRAQPQSWLAHLPQIVKVERPQEQTPLRLHQTGMQRQKLQEQRPSPGEEAGITSCHQVCQLHCCSLMTFLLQYHSMCRCTFLWGRLLYVCFVVLIPVQTTCIPDVSQPCWQVWHACFKGLLPMRSAAATTSRTNGLLDKQILLSMLATTQLQGHCGQAVSSAANFEDL